MLLYIFVCGHLPFDSNNVPELRKRVLIGQYRLPFFISSDCSSLISHMLTVDPEQRYTINDIKNHPWLMLNNTDVSHLTSQTQSIPNCQLTNAILDHAESLGYNRTQILKSVSGNSYDSDAAIWHLLLEKFQQTCQINSKLIINLIKPKTNFFLLDSHETNHTDINYSSCEPEIPIEELDNDSEDDDDDEETTQKLQEQYARAHGLRRHTVARPDLLVHNEILPTLPPPILFNHQSSSIEPSLLTNRLHHLQQQQQYNPFIPPNYDHESYSESQSAIYHQRNPHSTSYNGLFVHSPVKAVSDAYNQEQRNNHWLSPPVSNNFSMLFN